MSSDRPSAHEQATAVRQVWEAKVELGQVWCLLDSKWWQQWCAFVGFDPMKPDVERPHGHDSEPREIDNTRLVDAQGNLLHGLIEHKDYSLVVQAVYKLLFEWYKGGPTIERDVVAIGVTKNKIVDLYPLILNVVWTGDDGSPSDKISKVSVSARLPLSTVLAKMRPLLPLTATAFSAPAASSSSSSSSAPAAATTDPNAEGGAGGAGGAGGGAPAEGEGADSKEQDLRLWVSDEKEEGSWKLATDEMLAASLDLSFFKTGDSLLIDWKKEDGEWRRKAVVRDWRDFKVGDSVDARDTVNKWLAAEVIEVEETRIKVHYIGWAAKWDEWLEKDSERLAAKGTKSATELASYSSTYSSTYSSSYSSGYSRWGSYGSNVQGKPEVVGAVGLTNLGNTCFMNSTLQCLSNTPILTDFFVNGEYLAQLNRDNPLGWKGRIAEEYGKLLKDMWSDQYRVVAPSSFKQVLGEFQPRFSGYQQQDSSELLSFLLDGLHEDLNRVLKKPATQPIESNNRPDEVVAEESWQNHLKRNQSVIVDHLQGQLKSTLVCPKCNRVSITFDPFLFLQAPMPVMKNKPFYIGFFPADPNQPPAKITIEVSKDGSSKDIKAAVAKVTGTAPEDIILADVFSSRIYRLLHETFMVGDIQANDYIYAYEVRGIQYPPKQPPAAAPGAGGDAEGAAPGEGGASRRGAGWDSYYGGGYSSYYDRPRFEEPANGWLVMLSHQKMERNPYYNTYSYSKEFDVHQIGTPQLVFIPKEATNRQVRAIVDAAVTPFVKAGVESSGFRVFVTDSAGRDTSFELEDNDEPFGQPTNLYSFNSYDGRANFSIGVRWNNPDDLADKGKWDQLLEHASTVAHRQKLDMAVRGGITLKDCIQAFTQPEVLTEDNPWYCNRCKEHVCAQKQMDIWKLPEILIIHLKRFSFSRLWHEKIDTLVDFPLENLDMSQFTPNPTQKGAVYDLYAVSNHFGGMGGGHYNAFCKNLVSKQWFLHDDSSVSRVNNLSEVVSSAAYVLYYVRRDVTQRSPAAAAAAAAVAVAADASSSSSSAAESV